MPYLDVTPMMTALRQTPHAFELSGEWLTHIASWHSFRFGPNDQVEIRAACNCSVLAIKPDQLPELTRCFHEWESNYWRPLQINREFASHFARRAGLNRVLLSLTDRLHSWLVRPPRARRSPESVVQTNF